MTAVSAVTHDRPFRVLVAGDDISRALLVKFIRQLMDFLDCRPSGDLASRV